MDTPSFSIVSSSIVSGGLAAMWERTRAARYVEDFIPRRAARWLMARPSPGRRRIVIRSVAARRPGSGASVVIEGPFDSSTARIAVNANVDSETPQRAASSANLRFSSGVGRAVIDGVREVGGLLLTRAPLAQQNADTSLSCHRTNTNSNEADSYTRSKVDIDRSARRSRHT